MNVHDENLQRKFYRKAGRFLPTLLLLLAIACEVVTTTPGTGGSGSVPDAVKTGDSGWRAHRYGLWNKAWGSVSTAGQVDILNTTYQTIVSGGYVTTDANGQAEMYRPSQSGCKIYVFQDTNLTPSPEVISTCSRGTSCPANATFQVQTCKIAVATLPGNITFNGTQITIIENRDLESVIILASEGIAFVTPGDPTMASFEVGPGSAAYMVSPDFREAAERFFGFPPGELTDIGRFVPPLESLGLTAQMQAANLILRGRGFPTIPLPIPYTLGLRWLTTQFDDPRLAQAIGQGVDWAPLLDSIVPGIPVLIETQGERLDLRSFDFAPENAGAFVAEAGFQPGQEMILAYDESIPELQEIAANMMDQLTGNKVFTVRLQPFNADTAESVLPGLEASQVPVLVLSGL
jgi:hypothetical protein